MVRRLSRRVFLAIAALVTLAPERAMAASISVTPNPAPAGSVVAVSGSGFSSRRIRLVLGGVATGEHRATKAGTFTVGLVVAKTATSQTLTAEQYFGGIWSMVARLTPLLTFLPPSGADTTAPVITAIAAAQLTPTSERITWTTNEAASTQVEYGTTVSYGSSTTLVTALTTAHSADLTGLTAASGSTYNAAVLADGATGLWRLGETSGTLCNDAIGAADLTYTNAPTLGVAGLLTGDTDKAASFASASSQYAVGAFSATIYDTFTIEAMVKWTSGAGVILSRGTDMYQVSISAGGAVVLDKANVSTIVTSTTNLISATIAHVAVTKAGATVKVYIDGVDRTGVVTNATMVANWNELAIASARGGGTYFNGTLDEVAIYPTALSAATVTAHASAATAASGATTYHYRVKSTDASANQAVSGDKTFVSGVTPDVTAPTFTNIVATTGATTATITWTTNEAATARVEYGVTTAYGSTTATDATYTTAHSRLISGLNSGATYNYRVISADASGNIGTSANQTLATGTILTLSPGVTSTEFEAAVGNMNYDIIELAAGTYTGLHVYMRVSRATRPLTIRPALNAAVVFDDTGGATLGNGLWYFGSNVGDPGVPSFKTDWITIDGTANGGSMTIQNYSIGSTGVILTGWVDKLTINNLVVRNITGNVDQDSSHCLYIASDDTHASSNIVANGWNVGPFTGRKVNAVQFFHLPNVQTASLQGWTVTGCHRAAYLWSNATGITIDGWVVSSCDAAFDAANAPPDADASGTIKNTNVTTSGAWTGAPGSGFWINTKITNGGGNT